MPPKDPALGRAKKAFERGEQAYRLGRFEEALRHYKDAQAARSLPAFLFNIAQCYRNLKRWERARFFYRLYLAESVQAPNAVEVQERVAEMDRALAQEEHLRPVTVSVTTSPPGATVHLGGQGQEARAQTPAVLRLAPGSHLILLRLAGHRDEVRRVEVRPGRPQVVEITLAPLPRTVPYHQRWWFWTGISATALMVGVAAGTGTQALKMKGQWDRTGGEPDVSYDFRKRSLALRVTTDVLVGTAVLTVIGTVIGAAVVGRGTKATESTSTHVLPSCGPRGCGLWVQGRF